MTREDIIKLAREAKADYDDGVWPLMTDELERFAALVAAAERQAVGEDIMAFYRGLVEKGSPAKAEVEHCLSLIRLRAKS